MNKSAHKLAHRVAEIALSKKGYDIRILNLESLAAMTDYFVIISGEADVHVNAIAKAIDIELIGEVNPSNFDTKSFVSRVVTKEFNGKKSNEITLDFWHNTDKSAAKLQDGIEVEVGSAIDEIGI